MITVERYSDWAGNGGVPRGAVRVIEGTYSEVLDSSDECSFVIEHDARSTVALREVLRVTAPDGTVREYRVQSRQRGMSTRQRVIGGLSPWADLGRSGRVRTVTGGLTNYDVGGKLTLTEFLSDVVCTNLAADGLTWVDVGTVVSTEAKYLVAPNDGWTRAEWLLQLASLFAVEIRLRRDGENGYLIDAVAAIGEGATPLRVHAGTNLVDWQDDATDEELATAITVFGDTPDGSTRPATLAENAWVIGTASGSGPYWVPLTDPDDEDPPIVYDGQFIGNYLLTKTATTVEILDSRASDSAVQVASLTGLTAGEQVQFVADSDGTRLTEVSRPNVSRLHRTDSAPGLTGERNLVLNGLFRRGANDYAIADVTNSIDAGRYRRDSAITFSLTGGTGGVPSTNLVIASGTPDAIIYKDEFLSVSNLYRVAATTQLNGSGAGTIVMTGSVTVANGTTITPGGTEISGSLNPRINTFPSDNQPADSHVVKCPIDANSTVYPHSTGTHYAYAGLHSSTYTVKRVAGGIGEYVYAACGVTVRNERTSEALGNFDGSGLQDDPELITGRRLPLLRIDKPSTTSILAQVVAAQRVPAASTAHYELSCMAALSADTDVRLSFYPNQVHASGARQGTTYLRWWMLWLGNEAIPAQLCDDRPNGNAIFSRGQRGLVARSLDATQLRVSVEQLRAAGVREQVTLGGTLVFDVLDVTVRVVGVAYRAAGGFEVMLDSKPRGLSQYLAERVG